MQNPGACRRVVFGGAIAPTLRAKGVAPTLSRRPPAIFFLFGHFVLSDYLVNLYFLRSPVKVRK